MQTLAQLFQEHGQFVLKTFDESLPIIALIKLRGEIEEAEAAIISGDRDNLIEEYADLLMCVVSSAARADVTVDELKDAFAKKLAKNKGRTWSRNEDGTYSHVKAA